MQSSPRRTWVYLICRIIRGHFYCYAPSQNASTLGGILLQRAWLQGILVSNDGGGRLLLDDGTGVIELCLSGDFRLRHWDLGMYVMVIRGYFVRPGETPVRRMVDLWALPEQCGILKLWRRTGFSTSP
ncbi:hypothetical protein POTOM_011181 [Populus tomentosa]|uniref:Uncharacterized protein n=1 Tax=Populus tomentosa TaxID=118781 RepID=A0A8X8DBB3_POPTO|nr:hypothetical protein POTOM_011181 [Populus tomentosa]